MSPTDPKFDLDENYHKEVNKQRTVLCIFIKSDLYWGGVLEDITACFVTSKRAIILLKT